jgi:cytochrome c
MSRRLILYLLGILWLAAAAAETARHGLGRPATAADFARHGYVVGPKGTGLPIGRGTAREGRAIYVERCAACHGLRGEGTGNFPPLVGGQGSLKSDNPLPTVGSYWPYATTVWDYINRAMPYPSPGTLKPDEVYAVTAYVLVVNGIVPEDFELNERTLPAVPMPNRNGFVPDPRPDVK